MRKEKALIHLLRNLVSIIADEAERNPEFANKLDATLAALPERQTVQKKRKMKSIIEDLPDINAEWNSRGETDFRLWLRDQPIPVLRAIIREQDLDAPRRTIKWKEADKLSAFIADSLRARFSRGSAFIGKSTT